MKKRSLQHLMRVLHRDLGFLVVGLTIVFSFSGILLIYRGTDFMQFEHQVSKTIEPNLTHNELAEVLRMRRFRAEQSGDSLLFNGGYYLQSSGELNYTYRSQPDIFNKFNGFHKLSSRNTFHIISVVYAILLFFLAISSLFMFKFGTRKFYRGLILTFVGVIATVFILFLA